MPGSRNQFREPLLLIFSAFLLLTAISFLTGEYELGRLNIKPIDLLSEIKDNEKPFYVERDSLHRFQEITNSMGVTSFITDEESATIIDYSHDSIKAMNRFYAALARKTGRKKIRIAYFGDSMIEGDLITQDLRASLQDTFGGYGVGFMPVTSVVAGFRQSIIHSFSGDWKEHNLLDDASVNYPLGLSGHVYIPTVHSSHDTAFNSPGQKSWVRYTASQRHRLYPFYDIKCYYSHSTSLNRVGCNGTIYTLSNTEGVRELSFLNKSVPTINVVFDCRGSLLVHGFSFESDSGAFVDNLSFRGNSGMPLTKMSARILTEMNQYLDYDLLILHYGVNVVNPKTTDYSWYKQGMKEVVHYLKKCFPETSILIIGAGDKSYRNNGKYETDPSIPLVIKAQRDVAMEEGIAFWNLYAAMGGRNAMVKWVEGDTVYANRDYTHLNFKGAKRVGGMVYKALMEAYTTNNNELYK